MSVDALHGDWTTLIEKLYFSFLFLRKATLRINVRGQYWVSGDRYRLQPGPVSGHIHSFTTESVLHRQIRSRPLQYEPLALTTAQGRSQLRLDSKNITDGKRITRLFRVYLYFKQ